MSTQTDDTRDASLRVAKRYRDSLKAVAAVMGRPLYDVTNEAIELYLETLKLNDTIKQWRTRARVNAGSVVATTKKRTARRAA
jgi:predicted DNA-binding protein